MQSTDLITLTLLLLLSILITKHYFQYKLRKKTNHIKHLEKKLLSKDEMLLENIKLASLGDLLQNITHQWRQPLTAIQAVATTISFRDELGTLEDEELDRCLKVIHHNVMKLSATVDNFSVLFHNSTEKSYFDINKSFTYITDILQPQIYEANIHIEATLLNTEIYMYKSELMQVFMHILKNSIEILNCHKDKTNYIFATLKCKEDNIIIQIYDNAKGIPKEYISDIFELDFNVSFGTGSGSNLYACKKILEDKLGGNIRVDNHGYIYKEQAYVGARFCIEIPKK